MTPPRLSSRHEDAGAGDDPVGVGDGGGLDAEATAHVLQRQIEKLLVQVLQALPLHVARRVLKEGRIVQCRDEDALYDVAFTTIRAWERFKRVHDAYLEPGSPMTRAAGTAKAL